MKSGGDDGGPGTRAVQGEMRGFYLPAVCFREDREDLEIR